MSVKRPIVLIFCLVAFAVIPGARADITSKTYVDETVGGKQAKPASGVANGKVLSYTGNDASNVAASYIKIPVATAAPSTVTPSGFVEVWVQ